MAAAFAKRLQALRSKTGMTQAQLAEASGISVRTIQGYEVGQREPLWDAAVKLAKALGVSVEAFADAADDEVIPPARPRKTAVDAAPSENAKPKRTSGKRKAK